MNLICRTNQDESNKPLWKWFLVVVISIFLFSLFGFFYAVPDHPASVAGFKILYASSFNKKPFLWFYSPARRDVRSGYIPPDVDEYLCKRAETADEGEIAAIANFYSLQAYGRQGGCIHLVSDRTAERLVDHLVSKIRDEGNVDVAGEISILEQIRTRKSLGKGGINSRTNMNRPMTPDEWENWKFSVALPIARQRYSEWWNSPGTWEEKRKISPLEGTSVAVTYCCG